MIIYFNSLNDKSKHFLVSLFILMSIMVAMQLLGYTKADYFFKLIPLLITAIIGVGKEVYDRRNGGEFDFFDIMADVFGIFIGFVVWEFTFRLWL